MIVWGSISLAQSLLDDDLIDEIQLHVIPVIVGSGRRLVTEDSGLRTLTLPKAKAYASGIVTLRYGVGGS